MQINKKLVEELKYLTVHPKSRVVCWFSHGIASTVATKLTILANKELDSPVSLVVADIYLKEENEDNVRFYKQAKEWLLDGLTEQQKSLISFETLMSERYEGSVDNVIASTRYMSGVYGARCTSELKKEVRYSWQKPDDVHVFGMTVEEQGRIDRLLDSEADINIFAPLITQGFTKDDCFEVFSESGIKRPIMYDLGFSNNNCKGCLKAGGAGYWNLTRKHFPDVFNTRSKQEELLGVALVKLAGNVILNNHIDSFLNITNDILSGSLKELKVDGANKPLLKKGKPTDCTLLPKHLLGGVSEYTHYDGVVKDITYEGVLVNTYTLINKHPQAFKEMIEYLINTNHKGKMWGSSVRIPLRYLPENAGDKKSVEVGDCGFFCERKENDN